MPTLAEQVQARLPRVGFDSTLALLREGYEFGTRRFRAQRSDRFETRVMLRKAVFAYGEEAVREFYTPDRFTRHRALPLPALALLLDKGSVEMLDGSDHAHRKRMFLSLMTPDALAEVADLVEQSWRAHLHKWADDGEVVLLDALHEVLCEAVCRWAGVPLQPGELPERAREFAAMVDGAGAVGPRNWRGHWLRRRTERWAGDLVSQVRAGQVDVAADRALSVVAEHREQDGAPLPPAVAAVELINVLRPTVAVARFLTFAALALHEHPELRDRVRDDDEYRTWFAHEVRRYYSFFPVVGGRVREPFEWRGVRFDRGQWVLLDLFATNRDERTWGDPGAFRPERFRTWDGSAYDFVPQGGGPFETTHRCAGEWLTIEVVRRGLRLLTSAMTYEVPRDQDLSVDLGRMPMQPASKLRLTNVRSR